MANIFLHCCGPRLAGASETKVRKLRMAKSCYISTGRFRKGRKLRKLRGVTCRRTISVATARRCLSRKRLWLSLSMVPWQRTSLTESCERSFTNLVTAERNEKEEPFRKQRECKRGRLDDGDRGARFPKRRVRHASLEVQGGVANTHCKWQSIAATGST